MLGTGGTGAALAFALVRLGAGRIHIFDVDAERARALVTDLSAPRRRHAEAGGDLASAIGLADGIVHATPVGMEKYPGIALDPDLLQPRHWVSEIVYVPLEPSWSGLRARGGAGWRTGAA